MPHHTTPAVTATNPLLHLETLPEEIIEQIFIWVKAETGISFVKDCLTLSKSLSPTILRVIYRDLHISLDNAGHFLEKWPVKHGGLVRSLSLDINIDIPWVELKLMHEPWVSASQFAQLVVPSSGADKIEFQMLMACDPVWEKLERVSDKIENMSGLLVFSFKIGSSAELNTAVPHWLLAHFLKRLPETCSSVEIDTHGQDCRETHDNHLCDVVRMMLPRLKHLRLRLGNMCPAMFGKEDLERPVAASSSNDTNNGADGTNANMPTPVTDLAAAMARMTFTPTSAKQLKTLVINAVGNGISVGSRAELCRTNRDTTPTITTNNNDTNHTSPIPTNARPRMIRAMEALVRDVDRFPLLQTACFISLDLHSTTRWINGVMHHSTMGEHNALFRKDFVNPSMTRSQPCKRIVHDDVYSCLLEQEQPQDQHHHHNPARRVRCDLDSALALMESKAWVTTQEGYRFPRTVFEHLARYAMAPLLVMSGDGPAFASDESDYSNDGSDDGNGW